jgi:hypothetical protein
VTFVIPERGRAVQLRYASRHMPLAHAEAPLSGPFRSAADSR